MSPVLAYCLNYRMLIAFPHCRVCAVWTDGVSKQYAVEVADLAFGVCSGG